MATRQAIWDFNPNDLSKEQTTLVGYSIHEEQQEGDHRCRFRFWSTPVWFEVSSTQTDRLFLGDEDNASQTLLASFAGPTFVTTTITQDDQPNDYIVGLYAPQRTKLSGTDSRSDTYENTRSAFVKKLARPSFHHLQAWLENEKKYCHNHDEQLNEVVELKINKKLTRDRTSVRALASLSIPNLRSLRLENLDSLREDLSSLAEIRICSNHIESLFISNTTVKEKDLTLLMILFYLKTLRALKFGGRCKLNSEEVKNLSMRSTWTNLHTIDLYGNGIDSESAIGLSINTS